MAKRTRLVRSWVLDDDRLARLGESPQPCGKTVEKLWNACGKQALICKLIIVLAPTIADREGRLSGRTAVIWRELFALTPGISELEVEKALEDLDEAGYVTRYQAEGETYCQLNYFARDQNPDRREARSRIPPPPAVDRGFQRSFLWAVAAGSSGEGSGEGSGL